MPDKPLLLIDVDGVISLFGFPSNERPPGSWVLVDGTPHFLSAEAGAHLQALADPFELAWCTGWEEKANDYLPSALGPPGRGRARTGSSRRSMTTPAPNARSPGSTTR